MKRFQFQLEQLLSLRDQTERQSELKQQQALAVLEDARRAVADLEQELQRAANAVDNYVGRMMPVDVWQNASRNAARLNEQIAAAKQVVQQAERSCQQANRARARASVEAEAVRYLRSRQWTEHKRKENRRAQHGMDESILWRWLDNRSPATEPESEG